MADQGEAKNAISFTNAVEPTQTKQVLDNPSASKRLVQGYQPYVWQMNMNMDRLKDKKIRDAITYAMPNAQIVRINGGSYGGEIAAWSARPDRGGLCEGLRPLRQAHAPQR